MREPAADTAARGLAAVVSARAKRPREDEYVAWDSIFPRRYSKEMGSTDGFIGEDRYGQKFMVKPFSDDESRKLAFQELLAAHIYKYLYSLFDIQTPEQIILVKNYKGEWAIASQWIQGFEPLGRRHGQYKRPTKAVNLLFNHAAILVCTSILGDRGAHMENVGKVLLSDSQDQSAAIDFGHAFEIRYKSPKDLLNHPFKVLKEHYSGNWDACLRLKHDINFCFHALRRLVKVETLLESLKEPFSDLKILYPFKDYEHQELVKSFTSLVEHNMKLLEKAKLPPAIIFISDGHSTPRATGVPEEWLKDPRKYFDALVHKKDSPCEPGPSSLDR